MGEKLIEANGIEIMTESFGDSGGEPLILIMGASAPAIYWRDNFVGSLVEGGCFVIRYDNRDVGRSSCFDYSADPYTLDDMANDAVGVMDAYGLASAHVAGASMGGMIVQTLMVQHADRIKTATIIMSSPFSGGGEQLVFAGDGVAGPDEEWMQNFMAIAMAPASTREEQIEKKVKQFGALTGSIEPFDEEEFRQIAALEVDQARDIDAAMNHTFAIGASSPPDRRSQLKETSLPTLVIHGTEDPILPFPHGVALAETIPGAELLKLNGAGHELPGCYEDEVISAMLALQKA